MLPAPYIPDLFAEVVAKTAQAWGKPIFFDFGHYENVTTNQQNKSQSRDKTRYPLIWLVMDFEEQRRMENGIIELNPSPMIIIATDTNANYSMQQRRDKSFLPILYPIYNEFIRQISVSPKFRRPPVVRHTKVDRPFWGGGEGGKNLFNDFIDAIQLKNFTELQINVKC